MARHCAARPSVAASSVPTQKRSTFSCAAGEFPPEQLLQHLYRQIFLRQASHFSKKLFGELRYSESPWGC